jgi:NPCBM-associated, NEW3 domain of alpha-galactosidase
MPYPMTAVFRTALCSTLMLLASLFVWSPARAAATGEQTTAVILVNFSDNTQQVKTVAEVQQLVFGDTSDYLWESSYHQMFLSGNVFGWFTIPLSSTVCDINAIATEGNTAATAAGANLAAYSQVIYMFPSNSGCGWSGTGGPNLTGQRQIFIHAAAGFSVKVISHELGHRFGLMHSDAWDCDAGTLTGTCTKQGYADPTDVMGNRTGHYTAYQKERLGWLNNGASPPITTVTTSGRYTISPYEAATNAPKALKILKSVDPATGDKTWYYVEYRQPVGFDAYMGTLGNLTKGVMVHTGTEGAIATSLVLDMTPNTSTLTKSSDFEDGALLVGRSYTDTAAGFTISLAAADSTGATIDISVANATPTCTHTAPTVSLSGPTTAVAAGTTQTYALNLTNTDSSACSATSYSLAKSLPSGWTGTLGAASLTVSPGASASTTLSVTSPTTAAAGSYAVAAGISSASSVHTTSATATYSVAAAAALSESVGTDKTAYLRSETVYMSARVLNGGTPTSGASVRFNVTSPTGTVTTLTATSGSDGFARATLKLGKTRSLVGTWQLRADATYGGANATASNTFSVR